MSGTLAIGFVIIVFTMILVTLGNLPDLFSVFQINIMYLAGAIGGIFIIMYAILKAANE